MNQSELLTLAGEIATALGPGWAAQPDVDACGGMGIHLVGDVTLALREDHQARGRLKVGLAIGPDLWRWAGGVRRSTPTDIGVGTDRSAVTIAREITRRLLPSARAAQTAMVACRDEHERRDTVKWEAVGRIAEALGVKAPERKQSYDTSISLWGNGLHLRTEVTADDATLTLAVPHPLAVEICRLVRQRMEAGT